MKVVICVPNDDGNKREYKFLEYDTKDVGIGILLDDQEFRYTKRGNKRNIVLSSDKFSIGNKRYIRSSIYRLLDME